MKKLVKTVINKIRSIYLSGKATQWKSLSAIRLKDPYLPVMIKKGKNSKFIINGRLAIDSFMKSRDPVVLILGEKSTIIIDGDFSVGNGTQIFLDRGAHLYLGGRRQESESGITERSRIMVRKKIEIGFDCIIAWGVFITDSDWHNIEGEEENEDVYIGNHVWVSPYVSILKGSKIGNGCIIAAHSKISRRVIPDSSLAGGIPAKVLKAGVSWRRDMKGTVSDEKKGFPEQKI